MCILSPKSDPHCVATKSTIPSWARLRGRALSGVWGQSLGAGSAMQHTSSPSTPQQRLGSSPGQPSSALPLPLLPSWSA